MSLREVSPLTLPLALIAHQVFRRHETYRVAVHLSLLLAPPALVAAYVARSQPYSAFLTAFVNALLSYLAALVTSVVVYRLSSFHPLASYPGPVWRRVSMIGPAAATVSGNRHRTFADMHKQYGDIVRTGPNELSIVDPTFVEPLLGTGGLPKGPNHIGGNMSEETNLVGIVDIPYHLQRRRPWNRGLKQSALKEYEPLLAERAQLLVQRLGDQSGSADLGLWLKYFGYDFMCDMAFGGGSELLRNGDKNNVWAIIEEGMVVCTVLHTLPWLGIYLGKIPSVVKPMLLLQENGRQMAKKRLERGSKTRDLYHYLCNEDLSDRSPPAIAELADDGILTVVAGSDTASMTMTNVFYCLLTHPEAYAKLQAEIDKFYPAGEPASETKHHRDMHYLHAVINEALRLYPPVPLGSQRRVPHSGAPVVVGSTVLPPGTVVYLPPWILHRDPRNFSFPDAFWPERWLITSGQLRHEDAQPPSSAKDATKMDISGLVHNEAAFTPFSIGPMNCPGKGLAMLEMRTVIVSLMKNFSFKLRDGWDPAKFEEELKDYFLVARPELPVTIERRRIVT
ncbi:high nitrogen upregulated cytochrome P450 monooxygenase 2 [Polyporus arcularius HHB13444]|uniref:High nitrogen upregulated cytochrome P450 monooxygenase 2 n=1 Tax=Polyporus arcularius HHB13444 TaxID=1314778 RepID=A0A5C3NZX2_9APHY|nr:high nitrogen upregulated cytochrome P450 monooxygenase 2 [Polyporus arcularius HHB13444]